VENYVENPVDKSFKTIFYPPRDERQRKRGENDREINRLSILFPHFLYHERNKNINFAPKSRNVENSITHHKSKESYQRSWCKRQEKD